MKIGDTIHTNKNGLYGYGIIVDKKVIPYTDTSIILFKVEGSILNSNWSCEWINKIYLKKVNLDE